LKVYFFDSLARCCSSISVVSAESAWPKRFLQALVRPIGDLT